MCGEGRHSRVYKWKQGKATVDSQQLGWSSLPKSRPLATGMRGRSVGPRSVHYPILVTTNIFIRLSVSVALLPHPSPVVTQGRTRSHDAVGLAGSWRPERIRCLHGSIANHLFSLDCFSWDSIVSSILSSEPSWQVGCEASGAGVSVCSGTSFQGY